MRQDAKVVAAVRLRVAKEAVERLVDVFLRRHKRSSQDSARRVGRSGRLLPSAGCTIELSLQVGLALF